MKKVIVKGKVDYSKVSDPVAKNLSRRFKSAKMIDKRYKKPRYKQDPMDY